LISLWKSVNGKVIHSLTAQPASVGFVRALSAEERRLTRLGYGLAFASGGLDPRFVPQRRPMTKAQLAAVLADRAGLDKAAGTAVAIRHNRWRSLTRPSGAKPSPAAGRMFT
jgi:hypothetical protein